MRGKYVRGTILERFLAYIEITPTCWIWRGRIHPMGYGCLDVKEPGKLRGRPRPIHQIAHELFVGPIPEGLEPDHLCHTADKSCLGGPTCPHRRCGNPEHLELVTHKENMSRSSPARKTHCPKGHLYDEANTAYQGPKQGRKCRTCARECERRAKRWLYLKRKSRKKVKGATGIIPTAPVW